LLACFLLLDCLLAWLLSLAWSSDFLSSYDLLYYEDLEDVVEAPLHLVVNQVYRSQPEFLPARFHTRLAFRTVALPSVEPRSRLDGTGALPELEQVQGRQIDRLYRPWLPQIQSDTPYRWVIGSTLLAFGRP